MIQFCHVAILRPEAIMRHLTAWPLRNGLLLASQDRGEATRAQPHENTAVFRAWHAHGWAAHKNLAPRGIRKLPQVFYFALFQNKNIKRHSLSIPSSLQTWAADALRCGRLHPRLAQLPFGNAPEQAIFPVMMQYIYRAE